MTNQNTPGLDAEREAAQVILNEQGVSFGKNFWISHEKISGYTAEQLNSGACGITGRGYMDWVQAALRSQLATTAQAESLIGQLVVAMDRIVASYPARQDALVTLSDVRSFARGVLTECRAALAQSAQPASAPVVGVDAAVHPDGYLVNKHEGTELPPSWTWIPFGDRKFGSGFTHTAMYAGEKFAASKAQPADVPAGAMTEVLRLANLALAECPGPTTDWQVAALTVCEFVSAQPTPAPALSGVTDAERLAFLHSSNQDPEGYEYGVCRVKVTDGNVSCLWTASDHSDIDAIILKQRGCTHRFAIFNKNPNQRCMDCGIYQSAHAAASRALPGGLPAEPGEISDTQRLNFIGMNRVALIPEFEGPWDAQTYPDDASEPTVTASHDDVRGVIDAAIAATQSGVKGGA